MFTLRRYDVPVLAPGEQPLRVLHLSDLHLTPVQRDKVAWVHDLARLEPDLVVTTGDNLAHHDALGPLLEAYAPLMDRPGVFVLGSNDYVAPRPKNPARYLLPDARTAHEDPEELPWREMTAAFRRAGWRDLTNTRVTLELGGRTVSFVGVDDPHLDRDAFPAPGPGADLHLGVTHAPYTRVLDAMAGDGCDLVLAGHTHGGQLCVPFYGALVTNSDLERGRASGLHGWPGPRPDAPGGAGSTWLHVSAGLGTSPYAPFRFACRPEASLLTLLPR
ncbi:metallophosphoesterase [Georgenia sp. M64]|uniref:metallophosphoesterase n=1 Tax=Georgenia sp. M64 TaxID=3120520 RepID=UPI0030E31E37